MMDTQNVLKKIAELPLSSKLIGLLSFITIVSTFLPWYSDTDKLNTGVTYLGITGPLYLTGIIIILAAGLSLYQIVQKVLDLNFFKSGSVEKPIHSMVSTTILLLCLIDISAFYHPSFGINITDKNAGIGILLASFSTVGVLAINLLTKENKSIMEDIDHQKALKDLGLEERKKGDLDTASQHAKKIIELNKFLRETEKRQEVQAEGFRTPVQKDIPLSFFSKDTFNKQ